MSLFLSSPAQINKRLENLSFSGISFSAPEFRNRLFAIVLRDTPLRIAPSNTPCVSEEGFDLNCETLCRTCEPVMLLRSTPENGFYHIRSRDSCGYLHGDMMARISRKSALLLTSQKNMLYICDKFVLTLPSSNPNVSKIPLSFGSRIPIKEKGLNYTVMLPYKKKSGVAGWTPATISATSAVNEGALKFSRKNILKLSLRMRGMPYDWGESFGGCDCSSLVNRAFSLCGINLPRNSSEISKISRSPIEFNGNIKMLNKCRPGDIIVCDGHVMLYFEKRRGVHFVFHSFYGTRGITDITSVSEPTSRGTPLYESIRRIIPLSSL